MNEFYEFNSYKDLKDEPEGAILRKAAELLGVAPELVYAANAVNCEVLADMLGHYNYFNKADWTRVEPEGENSYGDKVAKVTVWMDAAHNTYVEIVVCDDHMGVIATKEVAERLLASSLWSEEQS